MATSGDNPLAKAWEKLTTVLNLAERARTGISENNGRLVALEARAKKIADPAKRGTILKRVRAHVNRQVTIASAYREAAAKLESGRRALADLFRRFGFSVPGLSGLGILPAVPLGVVSIIAAVGITAGAIVTANLIQGGAIGETKKVVDAVLNGQISATEGAALIDKLTKQAEEQMDPLGLKKAVGGLMPGLLIVGAVVLLPPLLETLRALRPRRAA